MPTDNRPLKVFLCHAHADRDAVRALYARLTKDGVDAWLDKANILPGQDWELEIRKAVREADVVVVCLSKQFNQAGFRQKEVRLALDTAMEKPEGEIFIIPARLEECDNLESLRKWHWVDLFEDDGYEMLMRAFRARADRIGAVLQKKTWLPAPSVTRTPIKPPAKEPAQKPQTSQPPSSVPPPRDQQIADYNEARALQHAGKLTEAAALYAKVGEYRDAPLRLRKLRLYLEAGRWMNEGSADKDERPEPWLQARACLEELLSLDQQFLDAPARLETVNRWIALPDTYGDLLDALDRDDWAQALPLFEQIRRVKANYQRTQILFERAWPQMVQAGAMTIVAQDGKEMVYVPAGEFLMGSETGGDDEKPPHRVYLDAFYIDRYPVTNAEYKKFVEAAGRKPPSHWENGKIPPGKETHPVVNVSWHDAAAYAAWAGKRLPTEAEWEKAASWDPLKNEKRVYPWGDRFDAALCNSRESSLGGTTPVGKYSPQGDSPYGAADMAGNVWEWCADWYDSGYYKNSPKQNPQGPKSGQYRVLRGGSWSLNDSLVRASYRRRDNPDDWDYYIGFRCSRSLP
ncbi:MAG: hypothetical protein Fur002_20320 [Anaerolineales bacterium]